MTRVYLPHLPHIAAVVVLALAWTLLIWAWMPGPVAPDTHKCGAGCIHVGSDVLVLTVPLKGKVVAQEQVNTGDPWWDQFVNAHGPWPTMWAAMHEAVVKASGTSDLV